MTVIKRWNIESVGWERYRREVASFSRGRTDVQIVCNKPGVIYLIEKEQHEEKTAASTEA